MLMKTLSKLNQALGKVELALAAFLMVALLVVALIQVVCRFILFVATPWSEEMARWFFVGAAWLAASAALNNDEHICINAIDSLIKKSEKADLYFAYLRKFGFIVGLFICALMTRYYWDYWMSTVSIHRLGSGLKVPLWIPQIMPLLGSGFMFLHCLYGTIAPMSQQDDGEGKT